LHADFTLEEFGNYEVMLSGNVGWSISYWNDNSIYFELNKVTFEEAYVEEGPF